MNPKRRVLLFILAPVIVTIIVFFFIIVPKQSSLQTMKEDIEAQRIQIALRRQEQQDQTRFTATVEGLHAIERRLADVFLTENDELRFFTSLEKIADETSITQTIDFQPLKAAKTPQPLTIRLTARGNFPNLLAYLQKLEGGDQFLALSAVSFSPFGGTAATETQATIEATVLWKPHG